MFGRRNPEKLEAKALDYERRGKTAKAQKYREKALRARGTANANANLPVTSTVPLTGTTAPLTGTATPAYSSFRTPQTYETNALKWEQRGNFAKAQKNREKVWRLQNPTIPATTAAPMFYDNNRFLGYNSQNRGLPLQQAPLQQGFVQGAPLHTGATIQNVLPAVVETHVHPTIIQQTSRPEKIVEVQPVVHREIDAPQVHVVERHSYEQVRSTQPGVITNQPIIQETLHPRVIEEIQPVVHREVPAPFVERVEQHVTEHVVQPTTMTKNVINDGALHTGAAIAAGGPTGLPGQPGFNQGLPGQPGFNQGLNTGLNTGLNQPGFAGQPGFNQGLAGQPGFNQGLAGQPGFNQGLNSGLHAGHPGHHDHSGHHIDHAGHHTGHSGLQPGLAGQPGLNTGINSGINPGLNTGLNSGLQPGLAGQPGINTGINSGINPGLNTGINSGINPGLNANAGLNSGLNQPVGTTTTTTTSPRRI